MSHQTSESLPNSQVTRGQHTCTGEKRIKSCTHSMMLQGHTQDSLFQKQSRNFIVSIYNINVVLGREVVKTSFYFKPFPLAATFCTKNCTPCSQSQSNVGTQTWHTLF